jgi:hypothetical protein
MNPPIHEPGPNEATPKCDRDFWGGLIDVFIFTSPILAIACCWWLRR